MLKVLKCVCVCVCEKPTCPARARGRCEGLQRASEATDGGNSWMGASSRSSMRGFLMFDSGLVRGVTLFLLIKVPGPLFTSCRVRNITFIIFFYNISGCDELSHTGVIQDVTLAENSSLSSVTSGLSLWVFSASTFRYMDSTLHP